MFRKYTLLVLLISLPLRLWAAESMHIQLNQPASVSVQTAASEAGDMMEDCPLMKNQSVQGHRSIDSKSGKSSCKACQLCMSFGFPRTEILFPSSVNQSLMPETGDRSFISADLAHLSKPPIS